MHSVWLTLARSQHCGVGSLPNTTGMHAVTASALSSWHWAALGAAPPILITFPMPRTTTRTNKSPKAGDDDDGLLPFMVSSLFSFLLAEGFGAQMDSKLACALIRKWFLGGTVVYVEYFKALCGFLFTLIGLLVDW